MVNWDDPSILLEDFSASCVFRVGPHSPDSYPLAVALIKLYHAIGGIYMCVRLRKQTRRTWVVISTWKPLQLGNCEHGRFRIGCLAKKAAIQVDHMGERLAVYQAYHPAQGKLAIPWNTLYRIACLCIFLH